VRRHLRADGFEGIERFGGARAEWPKQYFPLEHGLPGRGAFDRVLAELAPCLLAGGGPSHPIDLSTAVAVAGVAPPVQDVPADAAA